MPEAPFSPAEPDALTLVEPRTFGPYTLVAEIGRGGTGKVMLALLAGEDGFRKLVVLKLIHKHHEQEETLVRAFLDEARLATQLAHPHVVQTYEVGREERRLYIAMEYLQGLPLDRLLARCGQRESPLPAPIVVFMMIDLLDALAYAHTLTDDTGKPLGVVHRDVSPANAFLGWDGTLKLLDFGIAMARTRETQTDTGVIKGRFGYMAPEQVQTLPVDARTDVFSAGVVLWELLSGRRLFTATSALGTVSMLMEGRRPSLGTAIDPTLGEITERALERLPEHRYSTAGEMRDALVAWLDATGQRITRDDVAATLGDLFPGERERQHAMIRTAVGGATLTANATGSYGVLPISVARNIPAVRRERTGRAPLPRAPLLLGLLALAALIALVLTRLVDAPEHVRPERESQSAVADDWSDRTTGLQRATRTTSNPSRRSVATIPRGPSR